VSAAEGTGKDLQVLLSDGTTRPLSSFLWPTAGLMLAALLLITSMFLPYWQMVLRAPQYPDGLRSIVYVNHLEGDSREIDELNHYLGMPPLDEGGRLERRAAFIAISAMALLLMAATFVHDRRAVLLALPAVGYPLVFLADLQHILYTYGHSIDPKSALGGAIKPFTPPILGPGTVGQFGTESSFGPGFYLALGCAAMVVISMWLHRSAWMPVVLADRKTRALRPAVTACLAMLLAVSAARAEVVHTVGSGQPFPTIGAAIRASRDGDVVRVMPGTYRERFTVDRSIRLEGCGRPVIDGGERGTVIVLARPGITLRGFVIRASGIEPDDDDAAVRVVAPRVTIEDNRMEDVLFGIFAARTPFLIVRRNDISGKRQFEAARRGDAIRLWYCRDAHVVDNRVHDGRDLVAWFCNRVVIRGNDIVGDRYGIHFMYSNDAHVAHNRLQGNSVGIYTMYSKRVVIEANQVVGSRGPSGYALGFKDVDDVTVRNNRLLDNRVGIFMDGAPLAMGSYFQARENLIAYNDVGVSLLPSVRNARFERNQWVENGEQVAILGGGSAEGNLFLGNYWSDYAGFDADGDGRGDIPYRPEELFENLADGSPALRLFQDSLAQQAVDTAARLFPLVRPVPKLEDARPQVRLEAPILASIPLPSGEPLALAGLGVAGLLLLRLGILRPKPLPDSRPSASASASACATPAMVEIAGLVKTFGGRPAVRDVDLTVYEGEAVALWGSNGAGKTTIIRCLLGLLSPQQGTLRVAGLDVRKDGPRARRFVGYVPQELRFHDDLTVYDTMRFHADLRGIRNLDIAPRLAQVGLEGHFRHRVGELSGGLKQRLALALALLADPPVLLLDEPTSNLDRRGRAEFLALLSTLKSSGKTLLFSAHHLDEIRPLADRVVLLEQATMVRVCSPADFERDVQPSRDQKEELRCAV
jgi:nitrous oxidase accessory protein